MFFGINRQVSSIALFGAVAFSGYAIAGEPPVDIQPRAHVRTQAPPVESMIHVDSRLVLIPVGVTDALNRPVPGLQKNDFRIFDGKVEQQVLHLSFEDAPVAVGLLFDSSGSMRNKMPQSREAVSRILATANAEDEFLLVEFSDTARLTHRLTSETSEIQSQLRSANAKGQTALLDAIALGIREVKKSDRERKALVIISDGGDNRSRFTESEIRRMSEESGVMIYAMGIFQDSGLRLSAEETAGPNLLAEITERSGGHLFPIRRLRDLPDTASRIGAELHSRYVVGYSPANLQSDGRYHSVKIKVTPRDGAEALQVNSRSGYRAPRE